jgi:hypothetical protein
MVTVYRFFTPGLLQFAEDFGHGARRLGDPAPHLIWGEEHRRRLRRDRAQGRQLEMANFARRLVHRADRAPEHHLLRRPLKQREGV